MKIRNKETGELAYAQRWNLSALSEIIVVYPDGGADSDFARNWVCDCHGLPLAEDLDGRGEVMCSKE